jgi:hypothetical protein
MSMSTEMKSYLIRLREKKKKRRRNEIHSEVSYRQLEKHKWVNDLNEEQYQNLFGTKGSD